MPVFDQLFKPQGPSVFGGPAAGPGADPAPAPDTRRTSPPPPRQQLASLEDVDVDKEDAPPAGGAVASPAGEEAAPKDAADTDDDSVEDSQPKGQKIVLGGDAHVVLKGQKPWDISEQAYGEGKYWKKIWRANQAKFKKGLREGMVLDIPPMEVDTLTALKRFKDQPKQLLALVMLMPREEYEGFMDGLTPSQIDKHKFLLSIVEINRSTGKTMKELASDQRTFLKEKAAEKDMDVGEYVGEVVGEKGYGGGEAKQWNSLKGKERKEWKARFEKAVKKVKATAPPDVLEIIKMAENKGGGFRWSPKEIEEYDAFAFTNLEWDLHCGIRWVEAAEQDPSTVHGNIAHEMGGHNYYGYDEIGEALMLGALTGREEKQAEAGGKTINSAYGYMETEIFAELYEFPYNFPDTKKRNYPSDTAFDTDKEGRDLTNGDYENQGDVIHLLKRINESFAPDVARGLVAGLARRVKLDKRIVPEAKERFEDAVRYVFVAPP